MIDHPGFDPYEVLGVGLDADEIVIQLAHRARIREAHPDVAGPAGLELTKRLNVARDWLLDPDRRALLRGPRPTPPAEEPRGGRRRGPRVPPLDHFDLGRHGDEIQTFLHAIGGLSPDERARVNYSLGDSPPPDLELYREFLGPELWARSQALRDEVERVWERRVDEPAPQLPRLGRLLPTGLLVANLYAQWLLLEDFFREALAGLTHRGVRVADSLAVRCTAPWLGSVGHPRYGPRQSEVMAFFLAAGDLSDDAAERLARSWREHLGRDGRGHPSEHIGPGVWLPSPPDVPEVYKVSGYLAAVDATRIPPPSANRGLAAARVPLRAASDRLRVSDRAPGGTRSRLRPAVAGCGDAGLIHVGTARLRPDGRLSRYAAAVASRRLIKGGLGRVGGHVDGQLDVLAHEPATLLEGDVPGQAPGFAVDAGAQLEAGVAAAFHVGHQTVVAAHEGDRPSDVADGHVRVDLVGVTVGLDAGEHRHDLRELLGIEEVRRAQMLVALLRARRDAGHAEADLDRWRSMGSFASRSSSSSPLTSSNVPRTVETIMCLTEKVTSVWAGSIFQVLMVLLLPGSVAAWLARNVVVCTTNVVAGQLYQMLDCTTSLSESATIESCHGPSPPPSRSHERPSRRATRAWRAGGASSPPTASSHASSMRSCARRRASPLFEYAALLHLAEAEGRRLRMGDLALGIVLTRSGVTRLVDRLERDGLVERSHCTTDGRGAEAVLTEAGLERLREASKVHLRGIDEYYFEMVSEADQAVVGRVMADVVEGLREP